MTTFAELKKLVKRGTVVFFHGMNGNLPGLRVVTGTVGGSTLMLAEACGSWEAGVGLSVARGDWAVRHVQDPVDVAKELVAAGKFDSVSDALHEVMMTHTEEKWSLNTEVVELASEQQMRDWEVIVERVGKGAEWVKLAGKKGKKKKKEAVAIMKAAREDRWLRQEMVELGKLVDSPYQRRHVTAKMVEERAESMARVGQLHAIAVRPLGEGYEICGGHVRVKAARRLGWPAIRADVFEWTDDEAFLAVMEENRSRAELTPLEESALCADALRRWDVETTAARLGRSEGWVRRRACLQNLAECWLAALAENEEMREHLTVGHLEVVAKLEGTAQAKLLEDLGEEACDWDMLTVCELRRQAADNVMELLAPWGLEAVLEEMEPCCECVQRHSVNPYLPGLLEESVSAAVGCDQCLDRECYLRKLGLWWGSELARLRGEYSGLRVRLGCDWRVRNVLESAAKTGGVAELKNNYLYLECAQGDPGAEPVVTVEDDQSLVVNWQAKPGNAGSPVPKATPEQKAAESRRRYVGDLRCKIKRGILAEAADLLLDAVKVEEGVEPAVKSARMWALLYREVNGEASEAALALPLEERLKAVKESEIRAGFAQLVRDWLPYGEELETAGPQVCEVLGEDWARLKKKAAVRLEKYQEELAVLEPEENAGDQETGPIMARHGNQEDAGEEEEDAGEEEEEV